MEQRNDSGEGQQQSEFRLTRVNICLGPMYGTKFIILLLTSARLATSFQIKTISGSGKDTKGKTNSYALLFEAI